MSERWEACLCRATSETTRATINDSQETEFTHRQVGTGEQGEGIMSKLRGVRVAVLATDGFEESDLTEPVKALREAGARPQAGTNAWGCPQLLDD